MSYEAIKCLAKAASFIYANDSSLTDLQQNAATSKKRHAPKAGEERPSKRLLSGRAPVTSFHSSPSSSSSSSTAPTHWASTPRTGDYFASTAEENKAVASFQARNEITTRKLLSVLNSRSRLWATHEWFYSGVDQAYFNRCDFEEALQERGWSHLTTATRAEWGEVRAALGKPRRMSAKFLRGERHTLARYRTAVRQHQAAPHAVPLGSQWPFPVPEAPRVGEVVSVQLRAAHGARVQAQVTASSSSLSSSTSHCPPFSSTSHQHPHEEEGSRGLLCRGTVLACDVAAGEYRVQFDRPELGHAGHAIVQDCDLCVHGRPPLLHCPPLMIGTPQQPPSNSHLSPFNPTFSTQGASAAAVASNDNVKATAVPAGAIAPGAAAAAAAVAAAVAVLNDSLRAPTSALEGDWGTLPNASGQSTERSGARRAPPLYSAAPTSVLSRDAQSDLVGQDCPLHARVNGASCSGSTGCPDDKLSTSRDDTSALPLNPVHGNDSSFRLNALAMNSSAVNSVSSAHVAFEPTLPELLRLHDEGVHVEAAVAPALRSKSDWATAQVADHMRAAKERVKSAHTALLSGQTNHSTTAASSKAGEGIVVGEGMHASPLQTAFQLQECLSSVSEVTNATEGAIALVLALEQYVGASALNAEGAHLEELGLKCAIGLALDRATPRWLQACQDESRVKPPTTLKQPLIQQTESAEKQDRQTLPPPPPVPYLDSLEAEISSVEAASAEIFAGILSAVASLATEFTKSKTTAKSEPNGLATGIY